MTVTGKQQGVLGKGRIKLLKYQFQVASPRDIATGTVTGKISLTPISITKTWDAATGPLLQALENNESLSVTFDFTTSAAADGKEQPLFSIKLTNATVAAVSQSVEPAVPGGSEDVHFTYQRLDFEDSTHSRVSIGIVR